MKWLTKARSQEGSVLVLAAVGMLVILGFVGLAVDIGSMRFAKRHLQSAVDAAAIAAALEIPACQGTANCSAMRAAAKSVFQENGFAVASVSSSCTAIAASGLTLILNNPPCALASGDPNTGNTGTVEVIASEVQTNVFAWAVGYPKARISARAEAARTPNPNCIYALDPTGGNAITVDLLSTVSSACGIVDESNAWNALSCNLIASVTAPRINVVGGTQGLLCLPSTRPTTGIPMPNPSDPLAALPKPTLSPCGVSIKSPYHGSATQVIVVGTATLYPDQAYCGGINILPTGNVTFMPGTYVIKSNGLLGLQGGLSISLLANVTGTGVTFYNYGPRGSITMLAPALNLGSVNLSAPKTGTYACILFFQDPQNTDGANIIGSGNWNTSLEGAYYFPNANVLYAAALPVNYNILVAKDIEFAALSFGSTSLTSSFGNNYSAIPSGCPMSGGGSVLVQ